MEIEAINFNDTFYLTRYFLHLDPLNAQLQSDSAGLTGCLGNQV